MDSLSGYVSDDDLAVEPLNSLGWDVSYVSWNNPSITWDDFEAVIIRTPWDYHDSPRAFLSILEQIDNSKARLENSLDIVKWNLDKRYLRDLESHGVHIVSTAWSQADVTPSLFAEWQDVLRSEELVLKPTISATAKDTFRLSSYRSDMRSIFAGRSYMVQPFVSSIISNGEYSLFYFVGEYSHAIVKQPLPGDFRVQEEHGGIITTIEADADMAATAGLIMKTLPSKPLYARVDLVRDASGDLALMELELIEPALYFRMDDGAATRFAAAFDRLMNEL